MYVYNFEDIFISLYVYYSYSRTHNIKLSEHVAIFEGKNSREEWNRKINNGFTTSNFILFVLLILYNIHRNVVYEN